MSILGLTVGSQNPGSTGDERWCHRAADAPALGVSLRWEALRGLPEFSIYFS